MFWNLRSLVLDVLTLWWSEPNSVISLLHLIIVRWLVLIVAINGIAIARGLILKVDVSFFNPSREPCYELAHYETNLNNYFKSV